MSRSKNARARSSPTKAKLPAVGSGTFHNEVPRGGTRTQLFVRPAPLPVCSVALLRTTVAIPRCHGYKSQVPDCIEGPNFLDGASIRPQLTRRSVVVTGHVGDHLRPGGARHTAAVHVSRAPVSEKQPEATFRKTTLLDLSPRCIRLHPAVMQDRGAFISPLSPSRRLVAAAPAGKAKLTHPGKAILAGKFASMCPNSL